MRSTKNRPAIDALDMPAIYELQREKKSMSIFWIITSEFNLKKLISLYILKSLFTSIINTICSDDFAVSWTETIWHECPMYPSFCSATNLAASL
jgi:hypothetical protein